MTQSATRRTIPDVAFVADPGSGVPVYDSYDFGTSKPWLTVGGTSLSSPCWAGLAAIIDQGRALAGKMPLDGRKQFLPALYSTNSSNFHDVTTGDNGYPATGGYDLVTGRGTPKADLLTPVLVSFTVAPPPPPSTVPPNDAFTSAFKLSGTSATAVGTTLSATKQTGEPAHAGNIGGASVWYKWTPATSGATTISLTGSTFDTLLGVYTGSAVSSLTQVASNDDFGASSTSQVSFLASAGKTYLIAVDGYNDGSGAEMGQLSLSLTETITVTPVNDSFSSAKVLTGTSIIASGSNQGATVQTGEPKIAGNTGGKSVWYMWTAGATATTTISLAGSTFDTLLAVYKGSTLSALTLVKSNDDESQTILTSKVTFSAIKGTTYRFAVDGYNAGTIASGAAAGTIQFKLTVGIP